MWCTLWSMPYQKSQNFQAPLPFGSSHFPPYTNFFPPLWTNFEGFPRKLDLYQVGHEPVSIYLLSETRFSKNNRSMLFHPCKSFLTEISHTFDKRIRQYFKPHKYKKLVILYQLEPF